MVRVIYVQQPAAFARACVFGLVAGLPGGAGAVALLAEYDSCASLASSAMGRGLRAGRSARARVRGWQEGLAAA
jgi:hypothetical protein